MASKKIPPRTILLAICAAGLALRLIGLSASLRVDEIELWAHSRYPLSYILAASEHPPHAPLLTRLLAPLLGTSEAGLRLPYVLYGAACLPLMFLLGRRLFSERAGLLAALLLALSPMHINYSQEARYYPLLCFYALGALLFLLEALESKKPARAWLGCAACAGLGLATHPFGVFPAVLCAAIAAVRAPRGAAALLLLALAYLLRRTELLAWQGTGPETFVASYLRWHHADPARAGEFFARMAEEFGGSLWTGGGLAVFAAVGAARRKALPAALWLGLPLLSVFFLRSRTHFEFRYFIFLLPVYLAAAAGGAELLAKKPAALAALAAVLLTPTVPALADYYARPKSRMKEAASYISDHCREGDAVVMYPHWEVNWYGYYSLPLGCRLYSPAVLDSGVPTPAAREFFAGHERLWLSATWVVDPNRAAAFTRMRGLVERFYDHEERESFESRNPNDDAVIFSYRRKKSPASSEIVAPPSPPPSDFRMAGNVEDGLARGSKALAAAPFPSVQLVRLGAALPVRAEDSLVFAWEGNGSLRCGGVIVPLKAGDALVAPAGAHCELLGKGATLVIPFAEGEPAAGAPKLLGRVAEIPEPDDDRLGRLVPLLRRGGLQASFVRLKPGALPNRVERKLGASSPKLRILLDGSIDSGLWDLRFRRGDALKFKIDTYPDASARLRALNPGPGDAVYLLVTLDSSRS